MLDSTLHQIDALHQLQSYDYKLPEHLIAKHPVAQRDASCLLDCTATPEMIHRRFSELVDLAQPGDCLVLNDTQVLKARLFGVKSSGGRVEVFVIQYQGRQGTAFIKASKSPKPGSMISILDSIAGALNEGVASECQAVIQVIGQNQDGTFMIEYTGDWLDLFEQAGHIPLPPYMDRAAEDIDNQRYQTVWASKPGAVAAPTASLHFTQALLTDLENKGVTIVYLTLHVGAGTFAPIRVKDIREHQMHAEYYQVSEDVVKTLCQTKNNGGRIIAVGTTVLRALESLGQETGLKTMKAGVGETSIFIYPGFIFQVVDLLVTNFHLPQSTLLMLVSAFAGKDLIDAAYTDAIAKEYRFFSYGDAMILRCAHIKNQVKYEIKDSIKDSL